MGETHADIDRHIRTYLMVFGALLVLTAATVGAWKLESISGGTAIALALLIATVKASLVAVFFMHLSNEKKVVLWILALSVEFFFVLLLVPFLGAADVISL